MPPQGDADPPRAITARAESTAGVGKILVTADLQVGLLRNCILRRCLLNAVSKKFFLNPV